MTEKDDRLEEALAQIEAGTPVDQAVFVVADDDDLAALVRLAAAVRDTAHPEPAPRARSNARGRIWRSPMSKSNWLMPALAGAFGLLACAAFAAVLWLGSAWLSGPDPSFATVRTVAGRVGGSAGDGGGGHAAARGEAMRTGQRIRAGAAAGASLTFFEGTTTRIGSNAELALTRIAGQRGGVLQVELTQVLGTTSHSVVPLRGDDSLFVVHTPAGAARVRGTTFSVAVDPRGGARYAVDIGHVIVDAAEQQVELLSGQATVAEIGQAPTPPAYQFVGQGTLTSLDGTTWVIGGLTVFVRPEVGAALPHAPVVGSAL